MTMYYNSDPVQTRVQTKYPFALQSTLSVGQSQIPNTWIESLHFSVYAARFPLHIHKAVKVDSGIQLHLCDAQLSTVAVATLDNSGVSQVYTKQGLLCGTILYKSDLYSYMSGLVSYRQPKEYTFQPNSMIIAPQCITCQATQGCRFIQCGDGNYCIGEVTMQLQRNVYLQRGCTISVAGDWQQPQDWQIRLRTVNGANIAGKHLVIKPGMLSDLRVITSNSNIMLAGVKDA